MAGVSAERSERHIGADAERQHRALGLAILGDIGEPGANGVARRMNVGRLAVDLDRAAGDLAKAEQALHRFGAAGADEAVEADDLAGMQGERHAVEFGGVREIVRFEHDGAELHLALGIDLLDGAADHQADQIGLVDVGDGAGANFLAVAQAGPAIGDAENLVELVRDEENRAIVFFQLLDDDEEIADLARRQRGGRLVHDDDARVMRQRAGDLDQMLLRDAEGPQQRAGVEIGLEAFEQVARANLHLAPVDAPAARERHMAHENVLSDAELVEHHGFLVDRRDAGGPGVARSGADERLAGNENDALVGAMDAGQDFDQRRFARAILADQRGDFTRAQRQADVVQRAHAGKGFAHAGERQDRRARPAARSLCGCVSQACRRGEGTFHRKSKRLLRRECGASARPSRKGSRRAGEGSVAVVRRS